jgi:predicted CDP-diglyceride synthetase/phosphatidate cytidylyltransferase
VVEHPVPATAGEAWRAHTGMFDQLGSACFAAPEFFRLTRFSFNA